jgi:glycerophosphoryl diester phosphodiesterase
LSFDELQRYDVGRIRPGSEYAQRFAHQKPIEGTRIPRLSELFARTKSLKVKFNIETKLSPDAPSDTLPPEPFARALIAEIRKAGVEKRSTIQSFDWRTLKVVEQAAPEIATSYLTGSKNSDPEKVHAAGGRIWSPDFQQMNPTRAAAARRLGLKVIPWTVNESGDIRRMLELGVDGLISDYPERVREALPRTAS